MAMSVTDPTLKQEFIDASNVVYQWDTYQNVGTLTPLTKDGISVSSVTIDNNVNAQKYATDGFFAQAYQDSQHNIIITYEGTTDQHGSTYYNGAKSADSGLGNGQAVPALQDAIDFANSVHRLFSSATIYVTGHSLGGAEAQAAASNLSFIAGGMTFGAPGLPAAARGSVSPANFVNYVEYSDPIGNLANDALNPYFLTYVPPRMGSHYGTVQYIGSTFSEVVSYLPIIGNLTLDVLFINAAARKDAPTHSLDLYSYDLGVVLNTPVAVPQERQTVVNSALISTLSEQVTAQVVATSGQTTVSSFPIIVGPNSAYVTTSSTTLLSSWFSPSEKPAGTTHHIHHYLALVVRGSGSVVVDNQTYALGTIAANISPGAFASATFSAGSSSGVSEVALVAIDDAGTQSVAGDITVTVNAPAAAPSPIIANASINEPTNTTFLLSPFLSLPPPSSGVSISLVNFINTHTGPGQLTLGGSPTPANIAVAYANVGQVGFSTGSVTGSDKIEMYATYSNGTTSNVVDLTVNIQSTTPSPTPGPQNTSGPVINSAQPFQVIVGHTGVLSSTYLSATDTAYPDPSLVTYNISGYPTKGAIYDNGQFAHSFTQADVNAGHVTYQASMQAGLSSEITDSFSYTVSDPSFRQSPVTTVALKIEPLPAPPQTSQPYVDTNAFPTVREGAQIALVNNDLHVTDPNPNIPSYYVGSSIDGAITYTVVSAPTHGKLVWYINGYTAGNASQIVQFGQTVTSFSQNDIHNGWIQYINDFTSGAADGFTFTVSDGFGGTIGLTSVTIPVEPVNPINLRIDSGVFVTSGGQSIISPDWLRVEDAAPNANMKFTITQGPSHGSLLLSGNVATTFTQNDISGALVYKQNGGVAQSDQFTLAVTDAYGNSISNLVVPVTIAATALDKNTSAIVGVGQSVVVDRTKLHVADPGSESGNPYADPPSSLVYTVTSTPTHGALIVNGSSLHLGGTFTQDQINNGQLIYTEDGSLSTEDHFGFSIADIFYHNNFGSGTFNFTIANTSGGQIFSGGPVADIFFSGPGNNWVVGGVSTSLSYTFAPGGISVNLGTGVASNGFGGTDTISGVHSVVGSSHNDVILGSATSDTILGGLGADTLTGSPGADTFIFDSAALADAQAATPVFDRITDFDQGNTGTFNAAEGDQIDLTAVLAAAYNHGSGQSVSSLVRVAEDSSGAFAKLKIDPDGTANGAKWVTIARLDGLHTGNNVNVILDGSLPAGLDITALAEPDLTGNLNMGNVTVVAGGSLAIDEYTKNLGSGSASASTALFYLSADTTFNSSDILLATKIAGSLTGYGGGTSWYDHQAFSVTLASGLTPGIYYLGAVVDADDQNIESNENNNLSNVVQVTVTPPIVPADLTASLNMGNTTVVVNGNLAIDQYTKNFGAGTAGVSTTAFYLSSDTTFTTSDILLTTKTAASLTGYGSGTSWYDHQAFSVALSGVAAGTYYLGVIADANGQVDESNESNNVSNAVQIAVTAPAPKPDLVGTLNMGNKSVIVGGNLSIDEYTKNFGAGAAGASTTAFYLSTDATVTASDMLLTTKAAAALAAYGSGSSWYDHQAFSVALSGVAAGTYYLGAIADANGQVDESSEGNNVGNVVQITVTPPAAKADLVGTLNMSNASVVVGGSLAIDEYTKNFGAGAAGASTTAFYFSTDATVTASDMLLTTKAAAALAAYGGGTSWYDHQAFSVALSGIAAGTYYLGAIADANGQVDESSEGNNVGNIVQITVTPPVLPADLTASLNMGNKSVVVGGNLAIDEYTKNFGAGAAAASSTAFYLSTDATINTSDILLATKAAAALTAYGSGTSWYDHQAFSVALSGVAAGTYYLGAIADANGQVDESSEGNNVGNVVQITVTPPVLPADLTASLNMGSHTVAAGGNLAIDEYTKNFGMGASGTSTTAFYLSTDTTINTSDMLLATKTAAALTAYGSGTSWYDHQAFSVALSGVAAGTYYLGAIADAGSQIGENNETNNTSNAVQITVTSPADLTGSLNMGSQTVAAGGSLAIDEYTKNFGMGAAASSSTAFYLSTDAIINTSDMLLATKTAALLTGYGSGTSWYDHQTFSQSISTGLAAGTYYLGAIADAGNQVSETSETNNVSTPVQITVSTPADLAGNLNMGARSVAPGASLAIDEFTKNFGYGATAASTTAFYLSTDATIDTSDMLLATKTAAGLSGYGNGSGTTWYDHQAFSVTLSSGLADGTYYLGAIADAGGQIGELSETNNVWNVVQIVVDHTLI